VRRGSSRPFATLRVVERRRASVRRFGGVEDARARARAKITILPLLGIYDALTSRKSAARRNDGGVSRVMGSFRADAERARGEGSARARDEGAGALIILLELVVGVDVKIVVV
jgi:hypothetical protein